MSDFKVKLSSMPDIRARKIVLLDRLDGGLNICDLDYRLPANQSPDMLNMWWDNGVLGCRDGQVWIKSGETEGKGYTCFSGLFCGYAFFHIGNAIWYADPNAGNVTLTSIQSGVPQIRGTFFRYRDWLYYKTNGAYIKIKYTGDTASPFEVENITAFVPTIMRKANPSTLSGETYQPMNMLTGQKKVLYNAGYRVAEIEGTETKIGTLIYRLPERQISSIDSVTVDGTVKTAGTDYSANLGAGIVTFMTSPFDTVGIEKMENAVEITYTKTASKAYSSIMECTCATAYSVGGETCIVMGGGASSRNVYFWSGIDDAAGDGYFPYDQYTVGDTTDGITAFGRQQGMLIVFKENSIGKAEGKVTVINGRRHIALDYVTINAEIGCDLANSVQLVENNLVFCSSKRGVYYISNTSTAKENNIVHISRNIDGGNRRNGLLYDLEAGAETACSINDGTRYWLTVNGSAYIWDHALSKAANPSWFKFDNINAVGYITDGRQLFHMDIKGRITKFERCFYDYDTTNAIIKRYRFAVQHFDNYYQLKDVEDVIITMRTDTDSVIELKYVTDFEDRMDQTPLMAMSWKLIPRNLAYRYLGMWRFAAVFRRRPYCRHIRHFTMELYNDKPGQDMPVISAEIVYRLRNIEK